ncbi:MAG TPA: hypothetical protein VFD52_03570 [Clostridia bacterium]|nr:hypothetical protein [Clostridia bacterium]
MTSQKSSINVFAFTFWSAIKSFFYVPLIGMGILSLIIPITSYDSLSLMDSHYKSQSTPDNVVKLSDYFKYHLFGNEYDMVAADLMIRFIVIACAVILAIRMFKFITNKKTVNVYYSIGITRKNLFMSNFFAGLLMLFLMIAVPILICVFINISFIGSSAELWSAAIYLIIAFFALAFVGFGITAAVASSVGTSVECLVFSGSIIGSVTLFLISIENLMAAFVLGTPYSGGIWYMRDSSVILDFKFLNPLLFCLESTTSIGRLEREKISDGFVVTSPNYLLLFAWLAVAIGIFALGMYLFQKRKAEICGFSGMSKGLNSLLIFIIGFNAYSTIVYGFEQNKAGTGIIMGFLIGAIIYFIVYSLVSIIIKFSFKGFGKGLKVLGAHYAIIAVITLIFATGLFGYASRVPDLERVEAVTVMPVAPNSILDINDSFTVGDDVNYYYSHIKIRSFESKNDIKKIQELHKLIIKDGKIRIDNSNFEKAKDEQVSGSNFRITYILENGKKLERYYSVMTVKTLNRLLEIEETEKHDKMIMQCLTEPFTGEEDASIARVKELFQGEQTSISLISKDLSLLSTLKQSEDIRTELFSAIAKDLKEQSVEERYFPKDSILGSLMISQSYAGADGGSKTEQFYNEYYGEELNLDDLIEETEKAYVFPFMYTNGGECLIQITQDMTNTIELLRANDLLSLFEGNAEFNSAEVISSTPSLQNGLRDDIYGGSGKSQLFLASKRIEKDINANYHMIDNFINSVKVTDKKTIERFVEDGYFKYYVGVEGYFVKLKTLEKSETVVFIPQDKMPDNIAKQVADLDVIGMGEYYNFDHYYYAY